MKKGAIIQVINNDIKINFKFLKIRGISSYFTFAKGGYIIKINPIAKGMLVVPLDKLSKDVEIEGIKKPNPTPINMATNIQRVRKRSKKLNFFLSCVGVKFLLDIYYLIKENTYKVSKAICKERSLYLESCKSVPSNSFGSS